VFVEVANPNIIMRSHCRPSAEEHGTAVGVTNGALFWNTAAAKTAVVPPSHCLFAKRFKL
jgi:hypothetical protein